MGTFKRARTMLEDRLAKNPKDVDAMVLMARVKLAYGQPGEATTILEQPIHPRIKMKVNLEIHSHVIHDTEQRCFMPRSSPIIIQVL